MQTYWSPFPRFLTIRHAELLNFQTVWKTCISIHNITEVSLRCRGLSVISYEMLLNLSCSTLNYLNTWRFQSSIRNADYDMQCSLAWINIQCCKYQVYLFCLKMQKGESLIFLKRLKLVYLFCKRTHITFVSHPYYRPLGGNHVQYLSVTIHFHFGVSIFWLLVLLLIYVENSWCKEYWVCVKIVFYCFCLFLQHFQCTYSNTKNKSV